MLIIGSVFLVTGAVFIMFLRYVGRRQAVVVETALRTNAIVASLFPSTVRDRVLESNEKTPPNSTALGAKQRLKNFMNGDEEDVAVSDGEIRSKPIAGTLHILPYIQSATYTCPFCRLISRNHNYVL